MMKKRTKRKVHDGRVSIQATFNNTLITVSDMQGNVLSQSSAGACGFKGSRKSTPYAAQVAGETVGKVAKDMGMMSVEVYVKGPGPGRESAIRAFISLGFKITKIVDATGIPHNGTRPPKERRV